MSSAARRFSLAERPGNLSRAERWLSMIGGVGLLLAATRGGAAGRLARTGVGVSLLARGATGFCAVKAALQGESTLGDGLREQWRRLSESVASTKALSGPSAQIDNMEALYAIELQELHNAELQFCALANKLVPSVRNAPLAFRLQEYATELQSRGKDVESLLAKLRVSARAHADDAMRALIAETDKMAQVCAESVRDAALASSLQRIIHYKIAGYGTIAAYAKALGRTEEAAQLARLVERDKAIDAEISELAKGALNPEALVSPRLEGTPVTTH